MTAHSTRSDIYVDIFYYVNIDHLTITKNRVILIRPNAQNTRPWLFTMKTSQIFDLNLNGRAILVFPST